ncbi:MAG: GDP-mannose 4,6-dehydratase [Deltaproteobacteria bacterium]|nr:GDP-mannose 4,6-dehydratase [Deltaproteobacteria bacterium]
MRVMVTGASGFVGRRLLPALAAAGFDPVGTDREVDVTDAEALARTIAAIRPEAVVHLAALSSVAESFRDPETCYRVNFLGSRALLAGVARQAPRARVVLVGSADAYAPTAPQAAPLDEATPLRPRSPYARTKAAAELLGRRAAKQGLDVVCVRAFNHTGPGQSDQFVVSSFARQLAAIAGGRAAPRLRVGNLDSVRDFLHVDDVVDAYRRLLDPAVPADVYNVAGSVGIPIRDVLAALIRIAGVVPEVEVDPARHRPTDWLVGDATRLRRATGWQPRIAVETLLREVYADWLRRDGEAPAAPRT